MLVEADIALCVAMNLMVKLLLFTIVGGLTSRHSLSRKGEEMNCKLCGRELLEWEAEDLGMCFYCLMGYPPEFGDDGERRGSTKPQLSKVEVK